MKSVSIPRNYTRQIADTYTTENLKSKMTFYKRLLKVFWKAKFSNCQDFLTKIGLGGKKSTLHRIRLDKSEEAETMKMKE